MEKTMDILSNITICKLAAKIAAKGIPCEATKESVLNNLGALTSEINEFGETRKYLSLSLKEIILELLYEDSFTHTELTHSQDMSFWSAECQVFLTSDAARPKGEGRFAYTLKQYAEDNNMSQEDAVIKIGNWVRGLAKTRAIQAALPFLNLFCDEDIPSEYEECGSVGNLPIPKSQEEKKKEKLTLAEKTSKETFKKDSAPESSVGQKSAVENVPAKESNDRKDTSMSLEEAFSQVADVGNCAGYTLGRIYEKQPRYLIWLLNKGGSKLKEALTVIIQQDEELRKYL